MSQTNTFTTSSDAAEIPPVSQSTATLAPLVVVESWEAAGGERGPKKIKHEIFKL